MCIKKFGIEDLAHLLEEERRPVLLLGAGASYKHLPVAADLKKGMVKWLFGRVPNNSEVRISEVLARLDQPHITLELLCSLFRYRSGRRGDGSPKFDAALFWRELCLEAGCNDFSRSLAVLSSKGLIGPILTSNFDEMLAKAYESVDPSVAYQYITVKSLQNEQKVPNRGQEIIAFHGTIHLLDMDNPPIAAKHSPPTSALARGLATPFPNVLRSALLERLTNDAPIIVIGYRGGDYFDMNPFLEVITKTEQLDKWYWISHNEKVSENFSPFVRKRFPNRFFLANPHCLFPAYCREKLGIETKDPSDRARPSWQERMNQIFEAAYNTQNGGFLPSESDCAAILADLEYNLPGAWAVLEHYYLFSNSFLEDDTLTFAGVSEVDLNVDHLNFLGSSYGELLLAQNRYWKEDKKSSYPQARRAFKEMEDRITRVLYDSGSVPRPEYRSVLLVGLAYAADYLGLIENKNRMALLDLCEIAVEGAIADQQRDLQRSVNEARDLALQQFRRCICYAQEAQRLLENALGSAKAKDLGDLVQHELWTMIGEENVARALPPSSAWPAFKIAIERRKEVLESSGPLGENEYRCSHLTQLFLRASEMVKALLLIETDTQPPQRKYEDLSKEEREAVDWAIGIARNAFKEYSNLVGKNADRRFPAYFEAEIVYHASCDDIENARNYLTQFRDAFNTAPEKIKNSTRKWMQNAEKRFLAIERMLST
ncbi:MAG: SIR2 family protein [Deltaproteobacteria bacterium]|nr:SIR2 family protein [Deltaproteobacteria bacterium]